MSSLPSVPEQVDALLQNTESYIVSRQIHMLGVEAIPPLLLALEIPECRENALESLTCFGSMARDAIPAAVEILCAPDISDASWKALQLLRSIGSPSIGPLITKMQTASESEFFIIRNCLCHFIIESEHVVAELVKQLDNPDPQVRERCCIVLEGLTHSGDPNPPQVLLDRLTDPFKEVRIAAAGALQIFDNIDAVLNLYEAGNTLARVGCLQVLINRSWLRGSQDLEFFRSALSDNASDARLVAAKGLLMAATGPSDDVPPSSSDAVCDAVKSVLEDQNPNLRLSALQLCRRNSTLAFELRSTIGELCRDEDLLVRRNAFATFVAYDWKDQYQDVRSRFKEALCDSEDPFRQDYLSALREHNEFNKSMIPVVIDCLQDPCRQIVISAIRALGRIGQDNLDATQALVKFLDVSDPELCDIATDSIRRIGPTAAAAALPMLRELIRKPEHTCQALRAMEAFGPAAEPGLRDIASVIGQRTEIAPYVLAAIGTTEAINELAKSIDLYGRGDRKDFDASCAALCSIRDLARPVLESEFQIAKPDDVSWILEGLRTILTEEDFFLFLLNVHLHCNTENRFYALDRLWNVFQAEKSNVQQFIQTPHAISKLADALQNVERSVRFVALNIFATIHQQATVETDLYQERLIDCLRRLSEEDLSEDEQREVREIARTLDISAE